jgi:iron complex transport system ATP-binding protein
MLVSGPIDDVFNSATVSECFGVPVTVTRSEGRWTARAVIDPLPAASKT